MKLRYEFLSYRSTPSTNVVDTTSQLVSGSWVISLAECQGKTVDKHLSFKKGELIHVREQKDATWYSGQLHGKVNLEFFIFKLRNFILDWLVSTKLCSTSNGS
jgi:hypothetical protein